MARLAVVRGYPMSERDRGGICVYEDELERMLSECNIPHCTIRFALDRREGYIGLIRRAVVRPFSDYLAAKGREKTALHYEYELYALLMPFFGRGIVTVHHVVEDDEDANPLFYLLWRTAMAIALNQATVVIAISNQTKEDIVRRFGIRPERITVVPNTIGAEFRTLPDTNKEKLVLCVGTLTRRKNMTAAVRAFSLFRRTAGMGEYSMVICGKGEELEIILRTADECGVKEALNIVNDISADALVKLYNNAAMLLNTSVKEGFGNVTAEAQACSTPVVCLSDVRVPFEATEGSVMCKDEKAMSQAMIKLVTDQKYKEAIVERGLAHVSRIRDQHRDGMLSVYSSQKITAVH